MAKRRHEQEGGTALLDNPETFAGETSADELPPVPPAPPRETLDSAAEGIKRDWRVKLSASWLAPFITIVGCATEEEARAELHRYLDLAIKDVQPSGR